MSLWQTQGIAIVGCEHMVGRRRRKAQNQRERLINNLSGLLRERSDTGY